MIIAVFMLAGCREKPAAATTLSVFAPCGMQMPFMELQKIFEAQNPGVSVRLVLDGAHVIAKRVVGQGERPDVVVSPGGVELEPLFAAKLVDEADTRRFGQYELMLFVPRANSAQVQKISDLTSDRVKTIAVADPELTSIGRYTREGLQKLGLWEKIKSRVVITGDASMTYKHVASSKADASFAYRSCPLKTAPEKIEYSKVSVLDPMPPDTYGPAYATAVVLKDSPRRQLAIAFADMLVSPAGQKVLHKFDMPALKESIPAPTRKSSTVR